MAEATSDSSTLSNFETQLEYTFKDRSLLMLALTHASCGVPNNERMEFLGDALLKFIQSKILFANNPSHTEGDLTQARKSFENNVKLAAIAEKLNIGSVLKVSSGAKKDGVASNFGALAGALEAIYAAIYLDSNLDTVIEVVCQHMGFKFNSSMNVQELSRHPKSELQEVTIKIYGHYPVYESEPQNVGKQTVAWKSTCSIPETDLCTLGKATSIQEAESQAANKMLCIIQQ